MTATMMQQLPLRGVALEEAIEHQPVITAWPPPLLLGRNTICDSVQRFVWEFVALFHERLQPFMATILIARIFLTEPKRNHDTTA